MKNLWWGYRHTDGSLHVKRYFDRRDIQEAVDSPFVDSVFGPWECESREEAIEKIRQEVK